MINSILSDVTTSISELKKNPMGVVNSAHGTPIAVLNHNKPAFYCVSAEMFESLMDQLEDIQLAELARDALDDETEEVDLNDL